jgi:hypothetical protein
LPGARPPAPLGRGRNQVKDVMRRLVRGAAVAVALGFVVGVSGLFALIRGGAEFDSESRAYVNASVVAITARWDAEELWKRSTPHFRETAKHDALRAFVSAAGDALGPLMEYGGAHGQAKMLITNYRTLVSANYVAKGSFQNGDADFQMAMVKVGDTWMIEGFRISSSALMKSVARLGS